MRAHMGRGLLVFVADEFEKLCVYAELRGRGGVPGPRVIGGVGDRQLDLEPAEARPPEALDDRQFVARGAWILRASSVIGTPSIGRFFHCVPSGADASSSAMSGRSEDRPLHLTTPELTCVGCRAGLYGPPGAA
jgi:hypothetical protein